MKLEHTIELMQSKDFKERFRAEYFQLKIRMKGLKNMLDKYRKNELDFAPNCSYDLLNAQFKAMDLYCSYLEERAQIENVNIEEVE